jgi:hypothetical protein
MSLVFSSFQDPRDIDISRKSVVFFFFGEEYFFRLKENHSIGPVESQVKTSASLALWERN